MRQVIHPPSRIEATVVPPGDKSISQRAVLLNSIAQGTAHVSNLCVGDDRASMLRCLRGMGARIRRHSACSVSGAQECFEVRGRGAYGLSEPATVLDAGNSATTMRLVSGLMAALPFFGVISGDRSLRSRPMARIVRPLALMGAQIMGRGEDSLAPLAIRGGGLEGIEYSLPVASSQLKSCLLIAGLYASANTTIHQPAASRDHTERMLRRMGADIDVQGLKIVIRPSELDSVDVMVPGDIGSAAFWLVAACCHPSARIRLRDVGLNPTRTGVIDVLRSMGARVRLENMRDNAGEPVADLIAESSDLTATEISGDMIPKVIDELPVLVLAACFARGTTVVRDAGELRVKESDRIRATVEGLTSLGARVEESPDGMLIEGGGTLAGGKCNSHGDHRIAMTMGVAGLLASGTTVVEGAQAASISYPGFWETLSSISPESQGSP
jgi:3-phosphoshikimate 1-carboxyvinyltransferase